MTESEALLIALTRSAVRYREARERLDRDFKACLDAEISYGDLGRAMGVSRQAAFGRALKLKPRERSDGQRQ